MENEQIPDALAAFHARRKKAEARIDAIRREYNELTDEVARIREEMTELRKQWPDYPKPRLSPGRRA